MQTGIARSDDAVPRHSAQLSRLLIRPELGSLIGLTVVWTFFGIMGRESGFVSGEAAANYLEVAAHVGIIGTAVTLLMISGNFDLSVGAMVAFAGMILAVGVTSLGWPLGLALLVAFSVALIYGFTIGVIVVRTGLPSFIVTLGGLFLLRGLTIASLRAITGLPLVGGVTTPVRDDPLLGLFVGDVVANIDVAVIWWLGLSAVAVYVLYRTPFGNWIFATGGSPTAARALGVPVNRVKVLLFMGTAASGALLAAVQVLSVGSTDALRGEGKEFEGVITAVIGGALLHGGYGSPLGTIVGALTLGVVKQGLFFIGVHADWYLATLGVLLLVAALINEAVRQRAMVVRT